MIKTFFIVTLGLASLVSCQPRDKEKATQQASKEPAKEVVVQEDPKPEDPPAAKASPTNSMVLVNATNQEYRQIYPWQKSEPGYSTGFALYLGDGKFLTTANIVYEASYVDLRLSDKSQKVPAKVTKFDPEANLAILELKNAKDKSFLSKLVPIQLGEPAKLNDPVEIWQFNSGGLPLITSGHVQATEFESPFIGENGFTLYNIKAPITTIQGGASNPVMKDGKLTGLSTRCATENQEVIATTYITLKSFLDQINNDTYHGFPVDGLVIGEVTDATFRHYLGLNDDNIGIYISEVPKHGNFYQAGLRSGDVILSVNGTPIDSLGMYKDANLGPVSISTLINEAAKIGDIVNLKVSRRQNEGKPQILDFHVTLNRSALENDIINHEPFLEPDYRVYGGFTFTPLSIALIREILSVTENRMPPTLSKALNQKDKYREEGVEELVAYLLAIPTPSTLGYDSLTPAIVESVNGTKVKNFKQFNELLDGEAPNGIHHLRINRSPYSIYISKDEVTKSNKKLQASGLSTLQKSKQ